MPILNFTGRIEISHEYVDVSIKEHAPRLTIFLRSRLSEERKFIGCSAVIEAYRTTKIQRIELGRVENLPPSKEVVFSDFLLSDDAQFRIKIVEPSSRIIRGIIDHLSPKKLQEKQPIKIKPLLPVKFAVAEDNLGECFWKIVFCPNPVLILAHGKFASENDAYTSLPFRALVWPEILRQILINIYVLSYDSYPAWEEDWRTFTVHVLGADPPPEIDVDKLKSDHGMLVAHFHKVTEWIDDVVALFARHRNLQSISSEFKPM